MKISPMQIIQQIFNMSLTQKHGKFDKKVNIDTVSASNVNSNSRNQFNNVNSTSQCNVQTAQPACLLTRMHVIEITSNLPFAISLVV